MGHFLLPELANHSLREVPRQSGYREEDQGCFQWQLPLVQQHGHPTQREPDWLWDPDPSGPLAGAAWGLYKMDIYHTPGYRATT